LISALLQLGQKKPEEPLPVFPAPMQQQRLLVELLVEQPGPHSSEVVTRLV